MNTALKQAKHFTLAEMMTVILIIAILATIGVMVIGKSQHDAMRAATISQISNLYMAMESFKMENGYYPSPNSSDSYHIRKDSNGVLNSKLRKYFVFNDNDIDGNDDLLDAWGTPLIFIDESNVGGSGPADDAKLIDKSFVIYSYGPDLLDDNCIYDIETLKDNDNTVADLDDVYISDLKQ